MKNNKKQSSGYAGEKDREFRVNSFVEIAVIKVAESSQDISTVVSMMFDLFDFTDTERAFWHNKVHERLWEIRKSLPFKVNKPSST